MSSYLISKISAFARCLAGARRMSDGIFPVKDRGDMVTDMRRRMAKQQVMQADAAAPAERALQLIRSNQRNRTTLSLTPVHVWIVPQTLSLRLLSAWL
jgi:hypothetical protein